MTELLMLSYDYVDNLKNQDYYQEYLTLSKKIDTEYEEVINNFALAQEKYNEALEFGKYHPNLREYRQNLSIAKTELFAVEDIKRYNELSSKIEDEVNDLVSKMSNLISTNIPVINKYGFSSNKGGSCSGNCG